MTDSIISTKHHFYMIIFESSKVNSCNEIIKKLFLIDKFEKINIPKAFLECYKLEYKMPDLLGSENLVLKNNDGAYLYTLYLGNFWIKSHKDKKNLFVFCFPYISLVGYFIKMFKDLFIDAIYQVPSVDIVLEYFRNKNLGSHNRIKSDLEDVFSTTIIKYSATIKDEKNADSISILGRNPIDSTIYETLIASEDISIETSRLKIHATFGNNNQIDLVFDRNGGYKFWIPKDSFLSTVFVIPSIIQLFYDINAIQSLEKLVFKTSLSYE